MSSYISAKSLYFSEVACRIVVTESEKGGIGKTAKGCRDAIE